jgi:hypothetical protein
VPLKNQQLFAQRPRNAVSFDASAMRRNYGFLARKIKSINRFNAFLWPYACGVQQSCYFRGNPFPIVTNVSNSAPKNITTSQHLFAYENEQPDSHRRREAHGRACPLSFPVLLFVLLKRLFRYLPVPPEFHCPEFPGPRKQAQVFLAVAVFADFRSFGKFQVFARILT